MHWMCWIITRVIRFRTFNFSSHWPVGRAVTRSSFEQEVGGSNLSPVKSDTVLPTARHHWNISSKEAVLPQRNQNDAESDPAKSLHASAYHSKHKERFDLNLAVNLLPIVQEYISWNSLLFNLAGLIFTPISFSKGHVHLTKVSQEFKVPIILQNFCI